MSSQYLDMRRELRRLANDLRSKEMHLLSYTKAVGNRIRTSVIISLIEGNKDFSQLASELDVQKTTLSNHLSELLEVGLISKTDERGRYSITDSGLLLMESLEDFLSRNSRRVAETGPSYLISRPTVERIEMRTNRVKNIPVFQDSWLSLVGSLTGILKSFGLDVDNKIVAGYSGYSFIACMTTGTTSSAPPTAHPFFKEVHEGTESMGFKLFGTYEPGAIFPDREIKLADDKRLIKLFETAKEQIDKNNPVILWGPHTAEFSIVYGYDEDDYLVSSFRSDSYKASEVEGEDRVNYRKLHLPGGIWYYFFEQRSHEMTEEHDLEAMERALGIVRGKNQRNSLIGSIEGDDELNHISDWKEIEVTFVTGAQAFQVWQKNLLEGTVDSFGNAWTAGTYRESYGYARDFIGLLAGKYKDRGFGDDLKALQAQLAELESNMDKFVAMFPLKESHKREEKEEDLKLGAVLMRKCFETYQKLEPTLENIIAKWNS